MARFIFFDWETQSDSDLPVCGTLNYVLDPSTRPLLKSWCVDQDGPVRLWVPDLSAELAPEVWAYILSRVDAWGPPPDEIARLFASGDDVYVVAWNAAFDRHVWQQVATPDLGFPELRLEQVLDAMAQAQASNLPGQLDWAGRMLGLGSKTVGGKAIMKRFAMRSEPLPGARVLVDAVGHREGAVQKAGNRVPDYRETRNYVSTVMQIYALLKPPAALAPARRPSVPPMPGGAVGRGNMIPSALPPMPASEAPVAVAAPRDLFY